MNLENYLISNSNDYRDSMPRDTNRNSYKNGYDVGYALGRAHSYEDILRKYDSKGREKTKKGE